MKRESGLLKKIDKFAGIPIVIFLGFMKALCFFKRPSQEIKKIVLFKTSGLGDGILLLPSIHLLRRTFPNAEIVLFCGPTLIPLKDFNTVVDRFEVMSLKKIFMLRRERFDLSIDFDQWARLTVIFGFGVGARNMYGFKAARQFRHFAFDHSTPLEPGIHMARNFWNLAVNAVRGLGIDFENNFEFDVTEARRRFMPHIPKGDGKSYFVIHPGCGEHGKRREWEVESWIQLIQGLKSRYPQARIFVTGSGLYEEKLAQNLVTAGAESLVGKLSFKDTCSLLRSAEKVFCPNTGVMHLSSFLAQNVVGLHGPTRYNLWGPLWGGRVVKSPLVCAPCLTWGHDYGCSDPVCMKAITFEQVLSEINA